jgi:hypothetical protein
MALLLSLVDPWCKCTRQMLKGGKAKTCGGWRDGDILGFAAILRAIVVGSPHRFALPQSPWCRSPIHSPDALVCEAGERIS